MTINPIPGSFGEIVFMASPKTFVAMSSRRVGPTTIHLALAASGSPGRSDEW